VKRPHGVANQHGMSTRGRVGGGRVIAGIFFVLCVFVLGETAHASTPEPISIPEIPSIPNVPMEDFSFEPDPGSGTGIELPSFPDLQSGDDSQNATIGLALPDVTGDSSNAVVIILLLSVLSIAPSLLILTTSFTRIVIVMSLTRNALGIPQLPPQQVIVGLSIFLSLFIMSPTLSDMNDVALQPLMNEEVSFTEAADAATVPLREFMLRSTREAELEMFLDASGTETPVVRDEVPLTALIPAFVLSELKSAFIMGFIIFVPFMVIDIVVSAVLTSLGMMMLPPTFVSLPLKLLLFILLDGWTLIVGTLLASYQ
jgi:flagellar biosynthetic protein FliP